MFTLTLTLIVLSQNGSTSAISVIPGFTTRELASAAGNSWSENAGRHYRGLSTIMTSFTIMQMHGELRPDDDAEDDEDEGGV